MVLTLFKLALDVLLEMSFPRSNTYAQFKPGDLVAIVSPNGTVYYGASKACETKTLTDIYKGSANRENWDAFFKDKMNLFTADLDGSFHQLVASHLVSGRTWGDQGFVDGFIDLIYKSDLISRELLVSYERRVIHPSYPIYTVRDSSLENVKKALRDKMTPKAGGAPKGTKGFGGLKQGFFNQPPKSKLRQVKIEDKPKPKLEPTVEIVKEGSAGANSSAVADPIEIPESDRKAVVKGIEESLMPGYALITMGAAALVVLIGIWMTTSAE